MSIFDSILIRSQKPDLFMFVPLGVAPPVITAGFGGYTTIERPDDVSMTDWVGSDPIKQDVPLLLEGFADNRSVQAELDTLQKLGRDIYGKEHVPPVFQVFGPIYFSGMHWVLEDLEHGEFIRNEVGTLVRQHLVLHLMEFVDPETLHIRRRRKKKKGKKGGKDVPKQYTVRQGDTLIKIAVSVYGDRDFWKAIGRVNDIRDPHKVLNKGRVLKLPREK